MIDLSHIAVSLPVRFYSNTLPEDIAWPYVLVHLEDFDVRLRQYGRFARHIILDIHVHRFRHLGDYPLNVLKQYFLIIRKLAEKYRDRLCFVLPDLPFDPRVFHGVQYPYNVRKTYTYHVMFLKYSNNICRQYGSQVILVVQHRQSLADASRSCCIVCDLLSHIDDEHVYAVGVGSLCVNRSARQIAQYIELVARRFKDGKFRVHGFGVKLDVIDYLNMCTISRYSYDSTGWTRPVCNKVLKIIGSTKRYSCKTATERTIYFIAYVARLCEKLRMHNLASELWQLAEKIVAQRKIVH